MFLVQLNIAVIAIISVKRFNVGGPLIIHTHKENQRSLKVGVRAAHPFDKSKFRVCSRVYTAPLALNIPEEAKP